MLVASKSSAGTISSLIMALSTLWRLLDESVATGPVTGAGAGLAGAGAVEPGAGAAAVPGARGAVQVLGTADPPDIVVPEGSHKGPGAEAAERTGATGG